MTEPTASAVGPLLDTITAFAELATRSQPCAVGAGGSVPRDGGNAGEIHLSVSASGPEGQWEQARLMIIAVVDRAGVPRLEARLVPMGRPDTSGNWAKPLQQFRDELAAKYPRVGQ